MKLELKRKVTICILKVKKEDWFVMQSFHVFFAEQQFRWSKKLASFFPVRRLRADVCKYRPEVGKIKFLKNPPENYVDYPRYFSYENINFSFIG